MIEESTNSQNRKICWLCKWCGKTFLPRHQSRVLCQVLKIRCGDIAICIARIPNFYEDRSEQIVFNMINSGVLIMLVVEWLEEVGFFCEETI